jgi:hypothetical protein
MYACMYVVKYVCGCDCDKAWPTLCWSYAACSYGMHDIQMYAYIYKYIHTYKHTYHHMLIKNLWHNQVAQIHHT